MKKTFLSFLIFLLPTFVVAQSLPPTGITPYTLNLFWEYMKSGTNEPAQIEKAEKLLTTAGYVKVGKYDQPIGYKIVYAKACDVSMNENGEIEKVVPNKAPGYSSYIMIGPGIGMDWDMSLTFYSKKGTNAFAQLLKKAEFTYYSTENPGWVRQRDGRYFFQREKTFSVSDVVGSEAILE